MRSKVFLSFCLLLSVSGLPALEVQRGKIKFAVNERSGRLSVWGTEDPVKPVWTPLFLASDPTTSKWKVQIGDRYFVLGDDSSFQTSVEAVPTGAKVTWTGKTIVAALSVEFVLSPSAGEADGLRLTLALANETEAPLKVGARWVLDTNLGERKDHFRLANGDLVTSETKLESSLPDFWVSRPAADATGLLVMVAKGVTVPSRIVFANWKRLDDSPWDPAFKAGRDFNLLPYSFNDSAVAQFYDAQDLAPSATREITVVVGLSSAKTFAGARVGSANPIDDLLKTSLDPSLSVLDQDLASLDTLLAQIDAKLTDPGKVAPEDLRLLLAALEQIDGRRKALEASKP